MSDYYITGSGLVSDEELKHYGVIGMKWGVRRGKTSTAYAKASKKLKKLETKADKKQAKANKRLQRAERTRYGVSLRSPKGKIRVSNKRMRQAAGAQYKADKRKKKTVKWLNKMEKVFAETQVTMSKEQVALGERYAKELLVRNESWTRGYF